jgi:hypothetical protein
MNHNAEYACPLCKDRGYIGHIWELCNCVMGRDLRRELESQERAKPTPEGQMALTWENVCREKSDG